MSVSPKAYCHVAVLLLLGFICIPGFSATWYVRPDGGTRYSTLVKNGQCDGKADAAYPGRGTNQHCAFNDVRLLWQDGSWATDGSSFPAWGWIGGGGDTYIIRGSIADGVSYRVGWPTKTSCIDPKLKEGAARGLCGDQYGSGGPTPPSGTAAAHTRVLGGNWESCHAQTARTQLHGGWGAGQVLSMAGAKYVDVACLDMTDFSSCGRVGQARQCQGAGGVINEDYTTNGITWTNTSSDDTITDVRIHGVGAAGMLGPTGNGVVMRYIDLVGNPSSGWNADLGNGTTGSGSLLIEHYNISWNGCAEEYPITHPLPYQDCTDDQSGGYGDGFGTTTAPSNPGWKAHFDQGTVSYNTQDGLDALHLIANGSSMTVTRTLAYGNMGNQLKVGGENGTLANNLIVGNCNAMRYSIPGTPPGYNSRLTDFCRAGDAAVAITASNGNLLTYDFNTLYSANNIGIELECDGYNGQCDATSKVDFRNNVFVGFTDDRAHGHPDGQGHKPVVIYVGDSFQGKTNPLTNRGSQFSNNVSYGFRSGLPCPETGETKALCANPGLVDMSWHPYDYGNMAPASASSPVVKSGVGISAFAVDYTGATRGTPPARGALEFTGPASSAVPAQPIKDADGGTVEETQMASAPASAASELPHHHRILKLAGATVLLFGGLGAFRYMRGRAAAA